jgi:peptidoglycan/xylan/chitin deacetylase (PgdA/CDA1 family)
MDPVADPLRREVKTFLSFVAGADSERALDARTFHVTATYDERDFAALSERLADAGATGSFSMLARDLDVQAEAVAALADDGHEIALHGLRHTTFGGVDYDAAHDELATALSRFEDAAGVRPSGFHVPFMETSEGTVRAAADLGIEWLLGRPETTSGDLTVVEPVAPWDTRLLEGGDALADAFETLDVSPADDEVFLMHPNLQAHYGATDAFVAWLDSRSPVSVAEALDTGGEGVVFDCVKPIRVA